MFGGLPSECPFRFASRTTLVPGVLSDLSNPCLPPDPFRPSESPTPRPRHMPRPPEPGVPAFDARQRHLGVRR
ncbi:hypothetical protein GBA65_07875 [Rubrobacter marinus]|uniref:Uncharacterized protein n=1 Tax=Rubrobacter marinus TaxID=2653852 RepID=A0A6G8PW87_9ACTN|nr:hypothetical protein GBA65_07875 [Rubrobacter marinus]